MDEEKPPTFRVKICGITGVDDAAAVAQAGADAVGLNFYAKSVRFVDTDTARAIVAALPPSITKVGLFVNAAADEIRDRLRQLGLDLIQLHGDEPPQLVARLADVPVMKAFRVGPQGLFPVYDYIEQVERLGCRLHAVLLDAFVEGSYGGSGQAADWAAISAYTSARETSRRTLPPLVLAGGLTAENVARAIQTVRPAAVDTAGGVESSPGKKDAAMIKAFVQSAISAFK